MEHDHLGITEIAGLLGVSRQRAHAITRTHPDFPPPASLLASGPIWHGRDVKNWATARRKTTPGRKGSAQASGT